MLINPSTTPAIHHDLLFLIDCITPFSPWKIVFTWYRIKIYTWDLYKHIISWNVELQILQIVMNIVN